MELHDQLKKLFPDHVQEETSDEEKNTSNIWLQDEPLHCKYVKRKGKPTTIIEDYTGAASDFKLLTKELKTTLGVGGSSKNGQIIIQGDYRDEIMDILKEKGFRVKRVGG